jgi:hypothetical protein
MKFLAINLFVVSLAALASSKTKCNDGFADIHGTITSLYDHINMMETTLRVQYNNFHAERLNAINLQMTFLKTLQSDFFTNTCKYQSVEEGYGIYISLNEYINVVRKNVFYALKSAIDDLRTDNLNMVYLFQVYHADMVEKIAQLSKNLFNDGKLCVILLEKDIKIYFDTTVKKLMDAMRAAAQTNPLTVQSVKTLQLNILKNTRQIALNSKTHFGFIQAASNKAYNETAANNYNNVRHIKIDSLNPLLLTLLLFYFAVL